MSRRQKTRRSDLALIVRIKLGDGGTFGPGKAELLENIERLGSISAAARKMQMSYRQAWMLLDTLNEAFGARVVETSQGGLTGGGATLSDLGKQVLACYRTMEEKVTASLGDDLAAMGSLMTVRDSPSCRRRQAAR